MAKNPPIREASLAARSKMAMRATLITLVVIGHNKVFRDNFYYSSYIWIYSFHVGSFFLLATLSPPRSLHLSVLRGMLARFYKPFLFFVAFYGLLYLPVYLSIDGQNAAGWARDMLWAAGIATAPLLDTATGLKLLWFLPAFLSFCVLYNLHGQLSRHAPLRLLVWAATAVSHVTVPLLPPAELATIPLGLATATFLLFPALLFAQCQSIITTRFGPYLIVLLFLMSSTMAVSLRLEVILSDFWMPSIATPGRLALCDAQLILGALTCMIFARGVAGLRSVTWLGERSLHVYLLHAPFNIALAALFRNALPWAAAMTCTIAGTIAATAIAARLIEASPANPLVFSSPRRPLPSSMHSLRSALRWRPGTIGS